jgi:hypothetical protein
MSPINLAIVVTLALLHHPHDARLDAQLSNPHQNGGAALVVIHIITHFDEMFPSNEKPLPPPPVPSRPSSSPLTPHLATLSPNRFPSDESRPALNKKTSTLRLIPADESVSDSLEDPISQRLNIPATSMPTLLPSEEFGLTGVVKGKGRVPAVVGTGVVEELRRVYEDRSRIVRSQTPGRKESALKITTGRGGMGIGIGKVG